MIFFFFFQIQSSLKCLCSQLAQYELMSQQLREQLLQQQLKQQAAMQQAAKVNVTLPMLEQHLKSMENRIATNFERVMHQQSQRERILLSYFVIWKQKGSLTKVEKKRNFFSFFYMSSMKYCLYEQNFL